MIAVGYKLARDGYKKWYRLVQKPSDEKILHELSQIKKENSLNIYCS